MKYYYLQKEDFEGDLWSIDQDVRRLSDLAASYNLGVSFVDRATGQAVQLDFDMDSSESPGGAGDD